jgi:alpha-L-rhamnosidase
VNGASTLYENWRIDAKDDLSFNHIMFGEISAWMYKGLAGIQPDPEQPGFRHILLRPHFVTGLDRFEASHVSPYGRIGSSWKKENDTLVYTAVIPPNTTATLQLEISGKQVQVYTITAGVHTYRLSLEPGTEKR